MKLYILLIFIILFGSCADRAESPDGRIADAAGLADSNPREALRRLGAIDSSSLTEADRSLYGLITVKARDKAYMTHTSDSLIRSVIDYYARHRTEGRYPEALYYGGRVYSDLGDGPTALRYFKESIELLPPDTPYRNLRGAVLSQTGRLLRSLFLFDEAVPYIEASIENGISLGDTVNVAYDLHLLGSTYLRAGDYTKAEKCFGRALGLESSLKPEVNAVTNIYMGATKCKQGDASAALGYVRRALPDIDSVNSSFALGHASDIYLHAGIADTAYLYARRLIDMPGRRFKDIGYQVILDPKLRRYMDPDSLDAYYSGYRKLLESYYDGNKMELAIHQQTLYNYQLHERRRRIAEKSNARLKWWSVGVSFLILILVIITLYYKNKSNKNLIELHRALDNIRRLKENLGSSCTRPQNPDSPRLPDSPAPGASDPEPDQADHPFMLPAWADTVKTAEQLRQRLRDELLSLYNSGGKISLPPAISDSQAYHRLSAMIADGEALRDDDPLWQALEEAVLESSPDFLENLLLLTGNRLPPHEFHTALLVKCHVQPVQMARLLCRSKGTIVSRRDALSMKIFDQKMGTKVIDGIIRLL